MELGRFLVDAVVIEGSSPSELARSHPISRSWLFRLLARYKDGGYAALEPRSRRPKSSPRQVGADVEEAILELRRKLMEAGHDAGPQTIHHHLFADFDRVPSRATIWRVLKRHGLITPQPHKRPKSSLMRFEADLPNEMWQADATHWQLADGSDVEILNLIDDHSRLALACVAFPTVKAPDVLETFYCAAESYGYPAKFLSDNAAVFSGKSRRGRVVLESELDRLGIESKHSTPYHPQTCGKVERFHQTLKRYLSRQAPPENIAHLQNPARCLPSLLQPAATASSCGWSHSIRGLPCTAQSHTFPTSPAHPVPSPPRPARQRWPRHCPLPRPPPPHP